MRLFPLIAAGALIPAVLATTAAAAPSASATLTVAHPTSGVVGGTSGQMNSFVLANTSTAGQQLTSLRINVDAGPSMFPDILIDPPDGTPAGDTAGGGFRVDGQTSAGVTATATYALPRADGYGAIDVRPSGLGPGGELAFSFDIDPTSIKGTTGATRGGSISGGELHGATVTAGFSDGSIQVNDLSLLPGSARDSSAALVEGAASEPSVTRPGGATTPLATTAAGQSVVVTGPAGASGTVVVGEGLLDVTGAPGGGTDLDPFEANVLMAARTYGFTLGTGGTATVSIALSDRTDGAAIATGLNYVTAHLTTGGSRGRVSAPLVYDLGPGGGGGSTAYLVQGGRVTMDAENADEVLARSGRTFGLGGPAGSVGGARVVSPDTGGAWGTPATAQTSAPELRFRVRFPAAGTYRVWVRAFGPSSASDSVHAGLDGVISASSDHITAAPNGGWVWAGASAGGPSPATISVPAAGVRTVSVWAREDGVAVDRVVLALTGSGGAPTGGGPAESPRG